MESIGKVTLAQVVRALEILGGQATWNEIFLQVTELRNGSYSYYDSWRSYKETTRQVIHRHCKRYGKYKKGPTRFEKIGNTFRLISELSQDAHTLAEVKLTPIAIDIKEPNQPERVKQETYRILRDTKLARMVKESNKYKCQICGKALKLNDEVPYAEAHHIWPLGAPHNGPDVLDNIMCVCPNHHVLLDYGVFKLDDTLLKGIGKEYINYHNENIFGKTWE